MATEIKINQACEKCHGTGRFKPHYSATEVECPSCEGSGKVLYGVIPDLGGLIDDIQDKLKDLKEKVDEIKEVVDAL